MRNSKYIISIAFISFIGFLNAQVTSKSEFKDILKKIESAYTKGNIKVNYSRELIVPESSSPIVESTKGTLFIGEKGLYRLEENGTLIVQHSDFKMTIDSTEKVVLIDYVDKQFMLIEMVEFEKDSLLNQYDIFKSEKEDELTYLFEEKKDKATRIKIILNKNNYQIISLTYNLPPANYLSETLDDETIERPILLMKYEPIEPLKVKADLFSTKFWITENKAPLKLNTNITDYMLYDTRYSSHQ